MNTERADLDREERLFGIAWLLCGLLHMAPWIYFFATAFLHLQYCPLWEISRQWPAMWRGALGAGLALAHAIMFKESIGFYRLLDRWHQSLQARNSRLLDREYPRP